MSDKIDELDAEIAKLEKDVEDFKNSDGEQAEQYLVAAKKDLDAKKAELENTEADLKKAVDEPETPAPA
ncbi:hypothetical protein ERS043962_02536, partial [Streptococcus pneumoniae]